MFRKILAFLLRRKVVWIIDFDGEVNVRIVKETPFGYIGSRMLSSKMLLNFDGTVMYPTYTKYWKFA